MSIICEVLDHHGMCIILKYLLVWIKCMSERRLISDTGTDGQSLIVVHI